MQLSLQSFSYLCLQKSEESNRNKCLRFYHIYLTINCSTVLIFIYSPFKKVYTFTLLSYGRKPFKHIKSVALRLKPFHMFRVRVSFYTHLIEKNINKLSYTVYYELHIHKKLITSNTSWYSFSHSYTQNWIHNIIIFRIRASQFSNYTSSQIKFKNALRNVAEQKIRQRRHLNGFKPM